MTRFCGGQWAWISTRTPHAGSDVQVRQGGEGMSRFQPALPMRGVTQTVVAHVVRVPISTRTPHAGSDHPHR